VPSTATNSNIGTTDNLWTKHNVLCCFSKLFCIPCSIRA
jgi:hypothetical protein